MPEQKRITDWFGGELAEMLAGKISAVYKKFDAKGYIGFLREVLKDESYTARIALHAEALRSYLPQDYSKAVEILMSILGEENPEETGMFKNYYWIMPFGKFVEMYGLDDLATSLRAIEEITKRNTGEYAIRPYLRAYPKKTIAIMKKWSKSKNFHLRRLASEGTRPKLPWATKLDIFIDDPEPVFGILENLMEDDVKFVQKSVANNLADYFKVNTPEALKFIEKYKTSKNSSTQWILKHAMRRVKEV